MRLRFLSASALVLAAMACAHAMDVVDYQPALNARFERGWPNSPVPTKSAQFIGAKYDWSGVGWKAEEPTHNVAMITPRHFLFSVHNGPQPGGKLRFVGSDGRLREYEIEKVEAVVVRQPVLGSDVKSDMGVGTLLHSISSIDHIAHYPTVVFGPAVEDYLGKPLLLYGHGPDGPRVGVNEIVGGTIGEGEDPHLAFLIRGLSAGMARSESGDSGGPSFFVVGDRLAIAGTHHEVDRDVLAPALVERINAIVKRDGYTFEVIEGK